MSEIRSYRDRIVWQKGMALVTEFIVSRRVFLSKRSMD